MRRQAALVLGLLAVRCTGRDAGILQEFWHAPAAHLMHRVAAAGHTPLTVEAVIRSDGNNTLGDVFTPAPPPGFGPDIYNVQPALLTDW